jgi:hypothetical protein
MNKNRLVLIPALFVLVSCGKTPEPAGVDPDAAAIESPGANLPPVAPAIISPDEVANPTEPPSYEVAVASAAANRNKALARCAEQPEAVRTQCEQEANAAFAGAESDLQDLRGNKE